MIEYIGIIVIIILILWLIFHREKTIDETKENFYQDSLGKTIMTLPNFTKHYIGID